MLGSRPLPPDGCVGVPGVDHAHGVSFPFPSAATITGAITITVTPTITATWSPTSESLYLVPHLRWLSSGWTPRTRYSGCRIVDGHWRARWRLYRVVNGCAASIPAVTENPTNETGVAWLRAGTEVGIRLVRKSPLLSWTRNSASTPDCHPMGFTALKDAI